MPACLAPSFGGHSYVPVPTGRTVRYDGGKPPTRYHQLHQILEFGGHDWLTNRGEHWGLAIIDQQGEAQEILNLTPQPLGHTVMLWMHPYVHMPSGQLLQAG